MNSIPEFSVRPATTDDIERICHIYECARTFMREHGNPTQWRNSGPNREVALKDIEQGKSFVCLCNDIVVGTFFFAKGPDPTYSSIEGKWLTEGDYFVVHRIASSGEYKGVGTFCMQWAMKNCECLRIDTHADNYVMQNMLDKLGFTKCGIIYLENGDPRIAYEIKSCTK